jgi:hypothetical protein
MTHRGLSVLLLTVLTAATHAAPQPVFAAQTVFRSAPGGTSMLELFSSEGCSSCPPADAFFSTLKGQRGLWHDFVPAVFHVDYWDYLGWKDFLASPVYADRQRAYGRLVTPGFVLNGKPWWGRDVESIERPAADPGTLEVRPDGILRYRIAFLAKGRWRAHASLLGFGVVSAVATGENAGSTLRHDFVSLGYATAPIVDGAAVIAVKPNLAAKTDRYGVAVWITKEDDEIPVQAAGGYLAGASR